MIYFCFNDPLRVCFLANGLVQHIGDIDPLHGFQDFVILWGRGVVMTPDGKLAELMCCPQGLAFFLHPSQHGLVFSFFIVLIRILV